METRGTSSAQLRKTRFWKSCSKDAGFTSGAKSPKLWKNRALKAATANSAENGISTTSRTASARRNGPNNKRHGSLDYTLYTGTAGPKFRSLSQAGRSFFIKDVELREKHAVLQVAEVDSAIKPFQLRALPQKFEGDKDQFHLSTHRFHWKFLHEGGEGSNLTGNHCPTYCFDLVRIEGHDFDAGFRGRKTSRLVRQIKDEKIDRGYTYVQKSKSAL